MSVKCLMLALLIANSSLPVCAALAQNEGPARNAMEPQLPRVELIPRQMSPNGTKPPATRPGGQLEAAAIQSTGDRNPPNEQVKEIGPLLQTPEPAPATRESDSDPLAPVNRKTLDLNVNVDNHVVQPVTRGWAKIVPSSARNCLDRFFDNTGVVPRFANALFQRKFKYAAGELARFGINSTLGVGGLFDPAQKWLGLEKHDNQFGRTLAFYGMSGGLYVVVPLAGPVNVRSAIGGAVDGAMNPMNYLVPASVTVTICKAAAHSLEALNKHSSKPDDLAGAKTGSYELYDSVKAKYLAGQKRQEQDAGHHN